MTSAGSVARTVARRLAAASDPRTKEWWESYLKGAIPFRGVPMAGVRSVVHDVWQEKGLGHLPLEDQIEVALAQFGGRHSEDKIAGVLMLAELLVDSLETEHGVSDFVDRYGDQMSREAFKAATNHL